jgi:hypothetical protein
LSWLAEEVEQRVRQGEIVRSGDLDDPFLFQGMTKGRAKRHFAWFWTQAEDRIRTRISGDAAKRWQADYDAHRHLLVDSKGRRLRHWSGNSSIKELAKAVGLEKKYESDYRYLSQASHCTARGIMVETRRRKMEIRTTGFEIRPLLVFSTRYALAIAHLWNDRFGLFDKEELEEVSRQAIEFDFKAEADS